jgi:hypothetical protein
VAIVLQDRLVSVFLLSAALFTAGCAIRSDLGPDGQYSSDYVMGTVAARAGCGPKDPYICAAGSPWHAANFVKLAVSVPESADVSRFTLTVTDPLNFVIDVDDVVQGKARKGTIMVVEGRAMLTRGLSPVKAKEIDTLDFYVLEYQMLVSLLSQAIPSGPDNLTGTNSVNIKEQKMGLRGATWSASWDCPPPWELTGTVSRKDNETVDFSLRFTITRHNASMVMSFDGTWKQFQQAPRIDSSMPLSGWNFYLLGLVVIRQEGSVIIDYRAQSKPMPLGTLGELRRSIVAEMAGSSPTLQGTPASGRP